MKNIIDIYNEKISYQEGKIRIEFGGYTSDLMKKLYSLGYRASTSGIMHYLYDDKGVKVTTAYSWNELLLNTAITMR